MEKTKILFSVLLFILLSFTNTLFAQSKDSVAQLKMPKPTIALKDGATLFSADKSFNSQISDNKIVHDKASIANYDNKKDSKKLEMVTPKQSSRTVTKNTETKKQKESNKEKDKNTEKREKKGVP
ncbi:hypothetical protein OF897_18275 [Chryseobacterium formosus]|uniref:Uncharacterized protein n=1 Tax=Chryseobacterium formosus TaxID=1537363 RepID=A0ABT3XW72_9FLAO|nr:hypothetical protein [Chryseobacterium formosus]MCX8525864.1 hypothetical protein [Chryseobacterium formosus]